ncbi:hypothetical protein [Chroococcidiopsis sp. CCMEE 29]|nr:hypothetical protein [Chroococcidiopsis sp. CCMEE 29]
MSVFRAGHLPQTIWSNGSISDPLLPQLVLPVSRLFARRGE